MFRSSAQAVDGCTTGLTWIAGSMNISTEGGPERSINGPCNRSLPAKPIALLVDRNNPSERPTHTAKR